MGKKERKILPFTKTENLSLEDVTALFLKSPTEFGLQVHEEQRLEFPDICDNVVYRAAPTQFYFCKICFAFGKRFDQSLVSLHSTSPLKVSHLTKSHLKLEHQIGSPDIYQMVPVNHENGEQSQTNLDVLFDDDIGIVCSSCNCLQLYSPLTFCLHFRLFCMIFLKYHFRHFLHTPPIFFLCSTSKFMQKIFLPFFCISDFFCMNFQIEHAKKKLRGCIKLAINNRIEKQNQIKHTT